AFWVCARSIAARLSASAASCRHVGQRSESATATPQPRQGRVDRRERSITKATPTTTRRPATTAANNAGTCPDDACGACGGGPLAASGVAAAVEACSSGTAGLLRLKRL